MFKGKTRNRRLGRTRNVLDVKLRSTKLRAARTRLVGGALAISCGTVLGLYLLWRAGAWALDEVVYENPSFAIQQVDVQTDGVIAVDQLRRWTGIESGYNLFVLDLARVKRDLELVPMIQSASVERILPGTVRIRITEREPVAQINVARTREGGGIELAVFQLDPEGCVMVPLDPRQRAVPLHQAEEQLPVIVGISFTALQPGRRVESVQARAALRLIDAFESSPLTGLVELKRIDVSAADILVATTDQGSEITFGRWDLDRQMLRWWKTHEECRRLNRVIATLNVAVKDSIPLRLVEGEPAPPAPPRSTRPPRTSTRKRNV